MQSKINSFFKPSSSFPTPKSADPSQCCSIEFDYGRVQPEILVTYQQRPQNSICEKNGGSTGEASKEIDLENIVPNLGVAKSGKGLNKKRRGDEGDEKFHKTFHKNYTHGIPFKVQEVVKMMEMNLEMGGYIISYARCICLFLLKQYLDVL
ncbi:hypothetical protein HAX54_052475 [Datura stramonium]|uniref:Uncharacterized protein n=1 Tax=Datura stramonium TaxID=4076 RepID=A0ABS8SZX1_DATST|nr:hypothetical protein [Datura stramonium]